MILRLVSRARATFLYGLITAPTRAADAIRARGECRRPHVYVHASDLPDRDWACWAAGNRRLACPCGTPIDVGTSRTPSSGDSALGPDWAPGGDVA